MKIFSFEWFNNIEWSLMKADVLAESKEVAEQFVREYNSVDKKPWGDRSDSLRLIREEYAPNPPCFITHPSKIRP